jgi:arylsulfatase A-like enzyme
MKPVFYCQGDSTTTSRRDFLKVGAGVVSARAASTNAATLSHASSLGGGIHVDNVILIVTDSMRRDALSPYGSDWIHTPHFDRFAHNSVLFENAFLSSFPTVPCRNDILTGRYTFTYKDWSPLDERAITLQETLGKAGILTSLIADTPHPFAPGYNYQRGFSVWELNRGQESDGFRSAPLSVKLPCSPKKLRDEQTVIQYLRNVSRRGREEDYFSAQTFSKAADWLEENSDGRRFFLYLDTFDPHEPWDPPAYYVRQFDPGYTGEEVIYPRYDVWREFLSEGELKHCRALYAGEVTMVDRWFGFLQDRIGSLDLLKNTAVIYIADHGFYLGEHGYIGKCLIRDKVFQYLPLYAEVSRIPMMIYVPGCQGGTRIKGLLQPVDLMATILDLLGVAKPPSVEGSSLVPLLEGRTSEIKEIAVASPALFGSIITATDKRPPSPANRSTITNGEWLLIYGAQGKGDARADLTVSVDSKTREVRNLHGQINPELYNLGTDPGCTQNVISEKHDIAVSLHKEYLNFLRNKKYPEEYLRYFRRV